MEYGILGFLPVVVIIIIAVITKRTVSALLFGSITAWMIMEGTKFLSGFIDQAYAVGTSVDTVWLFLLMAFLLCLLGVLQELGCSKAFIKIVQKKAKSQKSTLMWSWIVAVALFIDETLSCAVLGTLSPLFDKQKIPRASLAYIADSTAAPFTTVVPVTAWAVFYQGVFAQYEGLESLGSPLEMYCKAVPFMFYAWAAILIVFLFVLGVIPPIGAMKKVYKRAEETGVLYSEESKKFNEDEYVDDEYEVDVDRLKLRVIVFLIALLFLTVGVIVTQDLLTVTIIDLAIVVVISLVTRLSNWSQLMDASYKGFIGAIPLCLIVFCAYIFRDTITTLGLPEYVISVAEPVMSPTFFPFVSFIACCLLTFATGSNWGTSAVYATIAVPLALGIGADPTLTIASIVSGATFGGHVCFYTDYTVQASVFCKIDNMEHALTQFPYGLIGGIIAAIAFLVSGFVV